MTDSNNFQKNEVNKFFLTYYSFSKKNFTKLYMILSHFESINPKLTDVSVEVLESWMVEWGFKITKVYSKTKGIIPVVNVYKVPETSIAKRYSSKTYDDYDWTEPNELW